MLVGVGVGGGGVGGNYVPQHSTNKLPALILNTFYLVFGVDCCNIFLHGVGMKTDLFEGF